MSYSLTVPVAFVLSEQFPRVCAMTGRRSELQRQPVGVSLRKNQGRPEGVPREVPLYFTPEGAQDFERARASEWFVVLVVIGGLFFTFILGTAQHEAAAQVAFGLTMVGLVISGVVMAAEVSTTPRVLVPGPPGMVELKFPDTAKAAYDACVPALAAWQRGEAERRQRAEAEAARRRAEEAARLKLLEQPDSAWGAEHKDSSQSDRWGDEVEPGWDEGEEEK